MNQAITDVCSKFMYMNGRLYLLMLLVCLAQVDGAQSMELIICRHGEADHNVGGRYNANPGHPKYVEAHLTLAGVRQVRKLGETLKAIGVTTGNVCNVFSSPLPRTRESAKNVMEVLGVHEDCLVIEPGLIETQVGDREGQLIANYGDKDIWFPEQPERFHGESRGEVKERVSRALERIRHHCRDQDGYILLFSHGVPALLLLEVLTGRGERLETAGYRQVSLTSF